MQSYLESTKLATERHYKAVKRASELLQQYFNLNNFYYLKITDSGDCFLFDDNQDVVDFIDSQEFILKHTHYCHPKYHRSKFQVQVTDTNPLLLGLEDTRKFFLNAKFNMSISLVNKTEHAVEEFGFHSASASPEQNLFVVNHLDEIKCFMNWFLNSNPDLMSFLQESRIHLPQLLGDAFYTDRMGASDSIELNKRAFLRDLGVVAEPNLSSSDQEVLRLTSRGFSPSQIGTQLYRSKRTIEHRLESLKEKLACGSKVELIAKTQELLQLGYL